MYDSFILHSGNSKTQAQRANQWFQEVRHRGDSDCKGEVRDEVVEVHPKYGSCYMDRTVCQNSWIGKPKTSHLY